jgi:hypothetical protein
MTSTILDPNLTPKEASFKLGQQYYRDHEDYPKGSVKAEFLRGVIFEERLTKCAYLNKHWNVSGNYKRL